MTIWHDRDEVPKEWEECVVVFKDKILRKKSIDSILYIDGKFMGIDRIKDVVKWAYEDDLIKEALK